MAEATGSIWWGQDPAVAECPACGCPVQGGPLGMSQHKQTVHPRPATGGRGDAS